MKSYVDRDYLNNDLTNVTLDGSLQATISNWTVAMFASAAVTSDLSVSALSTQFVQADAAKSYVDTQVSSITAGLAWKDDVVAATTAEITIATDLNVGDTIDGITLADGDRVLVKDQTTNAYENGIYIAGASPARATDMDASAEFNAAVVPVQTGGTANGGTTWRQTAVDPTVGVTSIAFVQFGGDVPSASTSVEGTVELATQAETEAQTDTVRAVTPSGLVNFAKTVASSTDNAFARFDGTSGDIQDSLATLSDTGTVNIPTGETYQINSTDVLSATALGTGVLSSSLTSVGTLSSGNATAVVDAATDAAAGKVELATNAETQTGTDATRAVTPAGLASVGYLKYYSATISSSTGATVTAATHGLTTVLGVEVRDDDGTNLNNSLIDNYIVKSTQDVVWSVDTAAINGRIVIVGV